MAQSKEEKHIGWIWKWARAEASSNLVMSNKFPSDGEDKRHREGWKQKRGAPSPPD